MRRNHQWSVVSMILLAACAAMTGCASHGSGGRETGDGPPTIWAAGETRAVRPIRVIVVRHAEKESEGGDKAPLSKAGRNRARELRDLVVQLAGGAENVKAVGFTSAAVPRVRQTIEPLAALLKRQPTELPDTPSRADLRPLLANADGGVVVIAARSTNLQAVVESLTDAVTANRLSTIDATDYDNLFLITIIDGKYTLTHLHYGVPTPPHDFYVPPTPTPEGMEK